MLGDERGGAAPRRDRVQRLHERRADHCADRIARASGPARLLKIGYQPTEEEYYRAVIHRHAHQMATQPPGSIYRYRFGSRERLG
jgi:hypothetical protein